MRLLVHDEDGRLVVEREHRNLICNAGVAQLAAATVWAAAQDQNLAMGSPLRPQVMYPIYGALGSSSTAASAADTQLGAELGRSVVADAGYSGSQILFTFFYPTSLVDWTITECGVFVSGASTATSSANSGLLLNHVVFGAVTKTAVQTATLQASFTF
jgi:hypothetical protein